MTTSAALTAAELAAAGTAVRTYLKANMPGWELAMVPKAKIDGLVAAAVAAVDTVRSAPTPAGPTPDAQAQMPKGA